MCDAPRTERGLGWQGWIDCPERPGSGSTAPWVDLTHTFSSDVPKSALFPAPSLTLTHHLPEDRLNVTRLETVVHVGTHVDAPRHFYMDGPAMDEVPLERLTGEGVVARIGKSPFGEITADDLDSISPVVEAGDILALCTGWAPLWGHEDWGRHPHLSMDAAEWLVDRKVKLLAVDTPTPDLAYDRRDADFDYPVHCALLKYGVLIAEQLANLETLAGTRVEFMFCPIPLAEGDGAPARVLARRLQ